MNLAFEILVIGLAALLALLLILIIVVVLKVKKLVAAIEHVVEKGEEVVTKVEGAAEAITRTAGPVGAVKTIMSVLETIAKCNGKD